LRSNKIQDTRSAYGILRPTHLLDTWANVLGQPLATRGRAMVLGGGGNPVSFVAADDIARAAVALALGFGRHRFDLGGPTAHTLMELNDMIANACRVTARGTMRIPVGALRSSSVLLRPFAEVTARRMQLAALLDTQPQVVDSTAVWQQFGITPTLAAEWLAANGAALRRAWQGQHATAAR
jgi:nucleoside-diphosphate-sugar epimerase